MYQKVILIGRISEPKVSQSQAGNTMLNFGLAVQASKDAPTEWFNCSIVGKFADAMKDRLMRGQTVFVEARASSNKAANGVTYVTHFVDTLRILNQPMQQQPQPQQHQDYSDPDLPF